MVTRPGEKGGVTKSAQGTSLDPLQFLVVIVLAVLLVIIGAFIAFHAASRNQTLIGWAVIDVGAALVLFGLLESTGKFESHLGSFAGAAAFFLAFIVLANSIIDSDELDITGTVTFSGTPLSHGEVLLQGSSTQRSKYQVDETGWFEFRDIQLNDDDIRLTLYIEGYAPINKTIEKGKTEGIRWEISPRDLKSPSSPLDPAMRQIDSQLDRNLPSVVLTKGDHVGTDLDSTPDIEAVSVASLTAEHATAQQMEQQAMANAWNALASGKPQRALAILGDLPEKLHRGLVAQGEHSSRANSIQGLAHLKQGGFVAAVESFRRAHESNPTVQTATILAATMIRHAELLSSRNESVRSAKLVDEALKIFDAFEAAPLQDFGFGDVVLGEVLAGKSSDNWRIDNPLGTMPTPRQLSFEGEGLARKAHLRCENGASFKLINASDAQLSGPRTRFSWQWQVNELPEDSDMYDDDRDNQAAQVLLVIGRNPDEPPACFPPERVDTIHYVWDTADHEDDAMHVRCDPFGFSRNYYIAVKSGPRSLGVPVVETRNILEDYAKLKEFDDVENGEGRLARVEAVAIQTNCQYPRRANHGKTSEAWISSLRFHSVSDQSDD